MFLHASYTARNLVKTVVSAGAVMAGGLGATILGSEAAFMMQGVHFPATLENHWVCTVRQDTT